MVRHGSRRVEMVRRNPTTIQHVHLVWPNLDRVDSRPGSSGGFLEPQRTQRTQEGLADCAGAPSFLARKEFTLQEGFIIQRDRERGRHFPGVSSSKRIRGELID